MLQMLWKTLENIATDCQCVQNQSAIYSLIIIIAEMIFLEKQFVIRVTVHY